MLAGCQPLALAGTGPLSGSFMCVLCAPVPWETRRAHSARCFASKEGQCCCSARRIAIADKVLALLQNLNESPAMKQAFENFNSKELNNRLDNLGVSPAEVRLHTLLLWSLAVGMTWGGLTLLP